MSNLLSCPFCESSPERHKYRPHQVRCGNPKCTAWLWWFDEESWQKRPTEERFREELCNEPTTVETITKLKRLVHRAYMTAHTHADYDEDIIRAQRAWKHSDIKSALTKIRSDIRI